MLYASEGEGAMSKKSLIFSIFLKIRLIVGEPYFEKIQKLLRHLLMLFYKYRKHLD